MSLLNELAIWTMEYGIIKIVERNEQIGWNVKRAFTVGVPISPIRVTVRFLSILFNRGVSFGEFLPITIIAGF